MRCSAGQQIRNILHRTRLLWITFQPCSRCWGGCKIIRRIFGIFLILSLLFQTISPVQAVQRTINLQKLDITQDIVVKAPRASASFVFPIPRLARIHSAVATISLTPGPQLHDDVLFSLYWEDKLLLTRTAKEIRQGKNLSTSLPLNGIKHDKIVLSVKSSMFISNDLCNDFYSGGLFFTVHKDTKIDLNYDILPFRSETEFIGGLDQSLLVVVPDNANLTEMTPAIWTFGALKKTYPHLDLQITSASGIGNRPTVPRIWVGLRNRLPAYFARTQSGIALADPNTLLVSADNVRELEAAARKLVESLDSGAPFARQQGQVPAGGNQSPDKNERVHFGGQGAREGLFQAADSFEVFPSLLKNIPASAGIHLEGSHLAASPQSRPARLEVYFNNQLVHSSSLDQSGSFSRDFDLPSGTELLAKNILDVRMNYPDDPSQCRLRGKFLSIKVLPNSYLWGTGAKTVEHFTWSNIGMFFGRQGTMIVDDKIGPNLLALAANFIVFLNRQLPPGQFALPAIRAMSEQSFIPPGQYVAALIKAGNEPPFLQEVLPNQAAGQFDRLAVLPPGFLNDPNGVIGRIATHQGAPVVVFSTKQNGTALIAALQHLNQPGPYSGLKGNTLAFRQPGTVYSVDIRDNPTPSAATQSSREGLLSRFWQQHWVTILVGIGIIAGIGLIILILSWKRRKDELELQEGTAQTGSSPYDSGRGVLIGAEGYAVNRNVVPVSQVVVATAQTTMASETGGKRRGRPRKTTVIPVAAPAAPDSKRVAAAKSVPPAKPVKPAKPVAKSMASETESKRRGRPPKTSVAKAVPAEPVAPVTRPGRPGRSASLAFSTLPTVTVREENGDREQNRPLEKKPPAMIEPSAGNPQAELRAPSKPNNDSGNTNVLQRKKSPNSNNRFMMGTR